MAKEDRAKYTVNLKRSCADCLRIKLINGINGEHIGSEAKH